MDLVEPLRMTLGSIHGLIDGKSELKAECQELELSLILVSQCLDSLGADVSPSVSSVITQLNVLIVEAQKKLEAIAQSLQKGGFLGLFAGGLSSSDKEDIAQLSSKLSKLCNFLNLALNTSHSAKPAAPPAEEESFDAAKFLPARVASFWKLHFGAKYQVPRARFQEALAFHLKPATLDEERLAPLGDHVSVYALNEVLEGGVTLRDAFVRAASKRKLARVSTVVVKKKARPNDFTLELDVGAHPHQLLADAQGNLTVGRLAHPFLEGKERLSREHAKLQKRDGVVYITDCSSNGVWVNGERLKKGEPVAIAEGDLIALLMRKKGAGIEPELAYKLALC